MSRLGTAGASVYAQVAALESCWYMRNQLLRDTDWSSMAHSLEVRVPYVDVRVLERIGPSIASDRPPGKQDLAACAERLPSLMLERPKTGFTTPVRHWISDREGNSERGLRGWAGNIHREFRAVPHPELPRDVRAAAE